MSPAEQEQRVLCEVLQAHGYAVDMGGSHTRDCLWGGRTTEWVWIGGLVWPPGPGMGTDPGPECDTPEDAIAWVLANVPRATASPTTP